MGAGRVGGTSGRGRRARAIPHPDRRQAGGPVRAPGDRDLTGRIQQDQHALAGDRRPATCAQVGPPVERVVTEGEVHLVERGACGHGPNLAAVQPDDPSVV